MKEICVYKDFMGTYSSISVEEAIDKVKNHGHAAVAFETDDRVITIVFWTLWGATKSDMERELRAYFDYVESITGIEIPVEIEMQ